MGINWIDTKFKPNQVKLTFTLCPLSLLLQITWDPEENKSPDIAYLKNSCRNRISFQKYETLMLEMRGKNVLSVRGAIWVIVGPCYILYPAKQEKV